MALGAGAALASRRRKARKPAVTRAAKVKVEVEPKDLEKTLEFDLETQHRGENKWPTFFFFPPPFLTLTHLFWVSVGCWRFLPK